MPAAAVSMSAAVSISAAVSTSPETPPATDLVGRHRRATSARMHLGRALDVVSRLGSLVTLAALVVLAATAGGLVDGMPVSEDATVTVTFDGGGR